MKKALRLVDLNLTSGALGCCPVGLKQWPAQYIPEFESHPPHISQSLEHPSPSLKKKLTTWNRIITKGV